MSYHSKINEVLSGNELLRVESAHSSTKRMKPRLAFVTFLCLIGWLYAFWAYVTEPVSFEIFLVPTALSITCGILLLYFVYLGRRSAPLILTDKGPVIPSCAANLWDEIECFSWETFSEIPGTLVAHSGKTCLKLDLKGLGMSSRWAGIYGNNIMCVNKIIFSPEQIATAEEIFCRYSVRKQS